MSQFPLPGRSRGRRVVALACVLLSCASFALIARSISQRGRAASAAVRTGLTGRQPAVVETARLAENDDEMCALIAGTLIEERERAGQPTAASVAEGRTLLFEAIANRPAAAHFRLLLGRSALDANARVAFWAVPLELAVVASPGLDAAPVSLAGGYLALWSTLNAEQKTEARLILGRAFQDPAAARRLFGAAVKALGPEATAAERTRPVRPV